MPRPAGAEEERAITARRGDDEVDRLCAALSGLRTPDEARRFLRDIATPGEIAAFGERLRIAGLLDEGALSYRDIAAATGASTTTIARVARFLKDEPHGGYRLVLDRLRGGRAGTRRANKG